MIALEKDINFEKKTTIKAAVKQIYHQEVHYHSNAIEMIFVCRAVFLCALLTDM